MTDISGCIQSVCFVLWRATVQLLSVVCDQQLHPSQDWLIITLVYITLCNTVKHSCHWLHVITVVSHQVALNTTACRWR